MTWIRSIGGELFGLIVDDVGFAGAVIVWIAAIWAVSVLLPPAQPWLPALFVGGLAALLLRSILTRTVAPS